MKRFTVPCDFGGEKHDFHIYVGKPSALSHPIYYQTLWLKEDRGGEVPKDVVDSFNTIYEIASENDVNYEDLCVYSLGAAQDEEDRKSLVKKAEGNVLRVDFKKVTKMAKKTKKPSTATSDDYYDGYCKLFGILDLENDALRGFSKDFSALVLPERSVRPAQKQARQFAAQMFSTILVLMGLGAVGIKKGGDVQIKELQGYLGIAEQENGYNIAVATDALGGDLSFSDLAAVDYFTRSPEEWKHGILERIQEAIVQWAGKKPTPHDIFCLSKFSADEKIINALKKTLKTLSTSL